MGGERERWRDVLNWSPEMERHLLAHRVSPRPSEGSLQSIDWGRFRHLGYPERLDGELLEFFYEFAGVQIPRLGTGRTCRPEPLHVLPAIPRDLDDGFDVDYALRVLSRYRLSSLRPIGMWGDDAHECGWLFLDGRSRVLSLDIGAMVFAHSLVEAVENCVTGVHTTEFLEVDGA